MAKERSEKKDNPLVAIGASVGGITLAMIFVIALFARDQMWTSVPIVIFMSFMGIMLGYFASKK